MWVNTFGCSSCKKNGACEYYDKFDQIVGNTYPLNQGGYLMFSPYSVHIYESEEIGCSQHSSDLGIQISFSCGAIQKWSSAEIKSMLRGFVSSGGTSNEPENIAIPNNKANVNNKISNPVTREDKIKKIEEILKIKNPIKIKQSSQINAYANGKNEIFITTAALDMLDLDELAFITAHEEAHITSEHIQEKINIINSFEKQAKEAVTSEMSFSKKLASLAGICMTGFVIYKGAEQLSEIEADVKAKLKLKEAGYWEDGGEKLFTRMNHPFSLGHPSSSLRKNILKNI